MCRNLWHEERSKWHYKDNNRILFKEYISKKRAANNNWFPSLFQIIFSSNVVDSHELFLLEPKKMLMKCKQSYFSNDTKYLQIDRRINWKTETKYIPILYAINALHSYHAGAKRSKRDSIHNEHVLRVYTQHNCSRLFCFCYIQKLFCSNLFFFCFSFILFSFVYFTNRQNDFHVSIACYVFINRPILFTPECCKNSNAHSVRKYVLGKMKSNTN